MYLRQVFCLLLVSAITVAIIFCHLRGNPLIVFTEGQPPHRVHHHTRGGGSSLLRHNDTPPTGDATTDYPVARLKKILILTNIRYPRPWIGVDTSTTSWSFLQEYQGGGAGDGVYHRGQMNCPVTNYNYSIELTFSPDYPQQMADKDAVILINNEYNKKMLFQPPDDQLVVFFGTETPMAMARWHSNSWIGDIPVHAVWSYTSGSEIHAPYGVYHRHDHAGVDYAAGIHIKTLRRQLPKPKANLVARKGNLVAWMASNCMGTTQWPRLAFVNKLRQHVAVDVYGKCGNLSCVGDPNNRFELSNSCTAVLSSYKFYLSLENAECDDYITEKLWQNALRPGVVPIVYGARKETYLKWAPPNSFIHVGDFKSVDDLATYIKLLDSRPDLYARYFEWQLQGSAETYGYGGFKIDDLCKVIPYIERLQNGEGGIEKRPLSTFSWFNTCRIKDPRHAKLANNNNLQDWTPWGDGRGKYIIP